MFKHLIQFLLVIMLRRGHFASFLRKRKLTFILCTFSGGSTSKIAISQYFNSIFWQDAIIRHHQDIYLIKHPHK
jgi:hypothetical protein